MTGGNALPAVRAEFVASHPFDLDPFQVAAMDALDAGRSVLVSAPTGSGKTVVADYAVARALAEGGTAVYTAPIKALSNQKHGELSRRFGPARVGLLTGDVSHLPHAPVVVMTTEVLRNMLFAGSGVLDRLSVVVLDEVHYLQDPYRGPVWEEILVVAPPEVTFVCLSATVHNSADFGAWIASVRGPTEVVVEARRPVVLDHLVAVGERGRDGVRLLPLLRGTTPHPDALALDRRSRGARRWRVPRRSELAERLAAEDLLPAITFIFSRAACDDAVRQCVEDGIRFTDEDERRAIREIVEESVAPLDDDDLATLGYGTWAHALEMGIAPHHAGLVPPFRRAAERCFEAGLLRLVFATETLALGINMPARTVVIERFAKFRGAERSPLHAGEYQQLTGRAGRRGIDAEGTAVVAWSPGTSMATVARVAAAAPPDLRSAFQPTYNLAVNLVRRAGRHEAHRLLASSYGQWQASAGSVSLPVRLDRRLAVLAGRGYVDGWRLTRAGERLAGLYHECDLLVAEAIAHGLIDDLAPPQVAAVVSAVTYEARDSGERAPVRDALVRDRLAALDALASDLRAEERRVGIPRTRRPDGGLARAMATWAGGASLAIALTHADTSPGDFVRNARQLADLLRQLELVAPDPATASTCAAAGRKIVRGVVAAGLDVVAAEPGGEEGPGGVAGGPAEVADGPGWGPDGAGGPDPGGVRH